MTHPEPTTPCGETNTPSFWRKHFPVEVAADVSHSRREFIGSVTVAGGAMVCGQAALNSLAPPCSGDEGNLVTDREPMQLDRNFHDLREGEAIQFHYPDHRSPCLLIRLGHEAVAFSQKCTHLACPVIPNHTEGRFDCPCHNGSFDLRSGQPLAGPPRSGLPRLAVQIAGDGTIRISGNPGSPA